MDKVANLSNQERNELFQQTAARRGLHPAIAEKDFWVCWALMKLFGSQLANHLVFKSRYIPYRRHTISSSDFQKILTSC